MTAVRWFLVTLALLAWVAWPCSAGAADEATQRADQLFRDGQVLFDQGKFDEACEAFEASLGIDWGIGTVLNLARCELARGRTATAFRLYHEGAAAAESAGDVQRARAAREVADDIERKLSYLTVNRGEAPRALVVTLDGKQLEDAKLGKDTPIDPGAHRLAAEAPGYEPWSTTIEVRPDRDRVELTIPRLTPVVTHAPERSADDGVPRAPPPTAPAADDGMLGAGGIGLAAAGGASVIVAAILGGITLSEVSDAEADPELCPGKVCSPEGRAAIDAAESKGIASTVLFGVGGAALVAGAILIGVDAGSDEVAVEPAAGPDGGSLTLRLRF